VTAVALALALPVLAQAATITHRIGTADTGATPNTSGAFTPAVNDLLVASVTASGTVQATATLTNSAGTTFTQFGRVAYATDVNSIYFFVANSLVTSATSQTVTFNSASDPATGTIIMVASVAGMSRTGTSAILQTAAQNNQAAGGTPAPTFASAVNTNNPTIGVVGNNSSPAGMTTPSSWVEQNDTGFSTPTTGQEYVSKNNGFTGTTITWGSTSATVFGSGIVELDTSAAGACAGSPLALLGVGCK
jgi:hypothetical protein